MNILSEYKLQSYNTSFDRYDENGTIDLDATYLAYTDLLKARNAEKYKDFCKSLDNSRLLSRLLLLDNIDEGVRLLKLTYLAMRIVDDICDKDILLELSDEQRLDLVQEIYNGSYSQVPSLDAAMKEIAHFSNFLGFQEPYAKGMHEIIHSMRYDLLRILDEESHKRTRKQLEENFHKMDIQGTEGNSALLLGIDPNNTIEKALFLGRASRIAYSLQDLCDDISKKIINIPIEDLEKYNISDEDLEQVGNMKSLTDGEIPIGVKKWIKQEVQEIQELLALHDEIFNLCNTLTNPPLEWGNDTSNKYKSSVMVFAFRRAYKKEILEIVDKTQKAVTGLDQLGLVAIPPARLFSISEALIKAFTYFYSLNSWDVATEVKVAMANQSDELCSKYKQILEITPEEEERYYTKSKNLTLMYLGFLDLENYSQEQLDGCVQAAFLSCAYDVCTDWGKGDTMREKFQDILDKEVSADLKDLAIDLFDRDVSDKLFDDGLDRGGVTMKFIGGCTGISDEAFIEQYGVNLEEMGRYLQMVDDIMDAEEDFEEFEYNFLANKTTREQNLQDFLKFFSKRYFHKQSLLQIGINLSVKKARKILEYLELHES